MKWTDEEAQIRQQTLHGYEAVARADEAGERTHGNGKPGVATAVVPGGGQPGTKTREGSGAAAEAGNAGARAHGKATAVPGSRRLGGAITGR